jgi:hypothetical protein
MTTPQQFKDRVMGLLKRCRGQVLGGKIRAQGVVVILIVPDPKPGAPHNVTLSISWEGVKTDGVVTACERAAAMARSMILTKTPPVQTDNPEARH